MRGMPRKETLYEKWLLRKVGFRKKGYENLMHRLYEIPFQWDQKNTPKDEDRALDGLQLRGEFFDGSDEIPRRDCTVLEMLVAFAIRIDDEWIGDPADPHPEDIFWEMVSNLDLWKMDNFRYDQDSVDAKVSKWVKKYFDKDGNGSIFPVKNANRDHRTVSIWSQMLEYINKNSWKW